MVWVLFWKNIIRPIFDTLLVTKCPIFKVFWDLRGAKMPQHRFQMGSLHFCVHPKWCRIIFGEIGFCPIFLPKLKRG